MTAANKRYSYPRVALIWIDVHHTWENLANNTCTLPMPVHICPAYAFYGWSPYVVTFHESLIELDKVTAPKKNGFRHNPQHVGWLIHGSVYPVSLPSQSIKQWRKSNICRQQTTRLIGPISPTCDQYIQYLLVGANPSVLNWHRWGL
jgi:hypothetical protein